MDSSWKVSHLKWCNECWLCMGESVMDQAKRDFVMDQAKPDSVMDQAKPDSCISQHLSVLPWEMCDFHWRVVEKCHAAELSAPGTLITVRIALHAAVVACSVHVNMVTLSMHWFNVGTLSFEVIFIPSWFNRRSFYFYIFLSYIAVAMHEFEGMFNGENSMLENLSAARTQKLLYSAAVSLHQIDCIDRVTLSTTGSVI